MQHLLSRFSFVLVLLTILSTFSVLAQTEAAETVESLYDVVIAPNIQIPMRDGVNLAADIYFPAQGSEAVSGIPAETVAALPGPWPVILQRTPYNKEGSANEGRLFAENGYVYVAADTRGRYASEGTFAVYTQEMDDGLDTVAWLNEQPWSNGQIGLTGGSYLAATANAIIAQDPPGLAAAFITITSSNYHEDGAWQGGAFELIHNIGYGLFMANTGQEASEDAAVNAGLGEARETETLAEWVQVAPLQPGASPFALAPSYQAWYRDWQTHELYDEYWQQNGYSVEPFFGEAADIPIMLVGGWYDRFLRGTLNAFLGYSDNNEAPVHLVINPSTHGGQGNAYAGNVDFGEAAAVDTTALALEWFDKWLKDEENGVAESDTVRLYRIEAAEGALNADERLQAEGIWQEFDSWPPEDVTFTELYLTPDRELQTEVPEEGTITYAYDPTDPVLSIGGNMTSGGEVAPAGAYDQRCREDLPLCEGTLPLNARQDVVSFVTEPLEEAVEVTGPLTVTLWVSSDAVDTDFTAKLVDVYPPSEAYPMGYALNLSDSIVRARFRSFEQIDENYHRTYAVREEPLQAGEVYEIVIDLWATSNLFEPGHRIRLDISSSNFPRFDANPNTGEAYVERSGATVEALNTIHMGPEYPSHLVLPVRSSENLDLADDQ